ncbi:MAG: nucleotidyltransferase domain-containing protein [Deferrisomatales bacterium]|nr:nucleotidyltransferase domain-containing protein [Deferrisomatales bacterium]
MLKEVFDEILQHVLRACREEYGARLVSLAAFGSVARGTMGPESDVDLLLVADPLPQGRMARVREFEAVDRSLAVLLRAAAARGVHTVLAPVLKTPEEVRFGSPLFFDMTREVRILADQDGFLRGYLDGLASRLEALGARRIAKAGGYYWLLKPDLEPREEICL